jgi:hypothetical protein
MSGLFFHRAPGGDGTTDVIGLHGRQSDGDCPASSVEMEIYLFWYLLVDSAS